MSLTLTTAGLDVTDLQPIPAGHPLVLFRNCAIVPHIASASVVTRGRMAAANLLAGLHSTRSGEDPETILPHDAQQDADLEASPDCAEDLSL